MTVLSRDFYEQNTLEVAKDLLGCKLCRRINDKKLSGIIVETEAYTQNDPACHAFNGKTPRSVTLFKKPGIAYVYLVYGRYHCFNVVTEAENTAGAVLIRAIEPIENLENTNGPGRLCCRFNITKEHNEIDLVSNSSEIWLESGLKVPKKEIQVSSRIGISKAIEYPWRFYIKDNEFVSKK